MKSKKVFYIIIGVLLLVLILAGAWWFYKKSTNPYSELTPEKIQEIGGQAVVDDLSKKLTAAQTELDLAIDDYKLNNLAAEKKPAEKLFINASNQAYYLHKYDLALSYLQDLFEYYDKSQLAWANMAHVYEAKGEYQQAIDTYVKIYDAYSIKYIYDQEIMQDYIALKNRDKVAEVYAAYKAAGYSSESVEQYLDNNK